MDSQHSAGPDVPEDAEYPGLVKLLRRAGHQLVTAPEDQLGQVMTRIVVAVLWPQV